MFVAKETNLLAPIFLAQFIGFDCGSRNPLMMNCSLECIVNSKRLAS